MVSIKYNTVFDLNIISGTVILPFYKNEVDWDRIEQYSGIQINREEFLGNKSEHLTLFVNNPYRKLILMGLGQKSNENDYSNEFTKLFIARNHATESSLIIDLCHIPEIVYAVSMGVKLGSYSIGNFKSDNCTEKSPLECQILLNTKTECSTADGAEATAETIMWVMNMVNAPAGIKTPKQICNWVLESSANHSYEAQILSPEELKSSGLNAILAVGRGSVNKPAMVIVRYCHESLIDSPVKLGLVGKGITFDTGGISIKGSKNLHYMKSDMGGAAAILGAVELAAKLKLKINLVGIAPLAENGVDANSLLPGDVIISYSGKTIEVIDTDAEGRLVLADALSYIQDKFQPEILIDLATLTGSCVRALGTKAAGLFSEDTNLIETIQNAATNSHESVWHLPMWDELGKELKSDIADIKNLGSQPVAGASVAAKFLDYFVETNSRWAHLDIAGVAFGKTLYSEMKSATGYGVKLLIELIKQLSDNSKST